MQYTLHTPLSSYVLSILVIPTWTARTTASKEKLLPSKMRVRTASRSGYLNSNGSNVQVEVAGRAYSHKSAGLSNASNSHFVKVYG